ncbi:MAG TPA: hypothetical protein VFB67_11165, partial [Candidatus Polarisedimenticolaceae bacterium]|nr:hypothetical protein [Candidatus Polarisedimenticolaceae bacterium]
MKRPEILLAVAASLVDPRVAKIDLDVTLDPEHGTLRETASLSVAARGVAHLTFAIDEGLVVKTARAS